MYFIFFFLESKDCNYVFFFFSSRRRHTRWNCDWSSDVCSSDLLGLATLVLPWGGCQYAREMESALREGEENSLQAVSQTIAASLQGRTDLLYRESVPPADAAGAPPD